MGLVTGFHPVVFALIFRRIVNFQVHVELLVASEVAILAVGLTALCLGAGIAIGHVERFSKYLVSKSSP